MVAVMLAAASDITVPDPETGHLAGISFVEHFEVCIRVGSDNKIELELSQLFY